MRTHTDQSWKKPKLWLLVLFVLTYWTVLIYLLNCKPLFIRLALVQMPCSLFVVLNLEMSIQYQALLLCNLHGLRDTHRSRKFPFYLLYLVIMKMVQIMCGPCSFRFFLLKFRKNLCPVLTVAKNTAFFFLCWRIVEFYLQHPVLLLLPLLSNNSSFFRNWVYIPDIFNMKTKESLLSWVFWFFLINKNNLKKKNRINRRWVGSFMFQVMLTFR